MLRFSANLSTLFQDIPLEQRFAAAAKAGFEAVEMWFPYEMPGPKMRELLQAHGLRCVGINSPAGDVASGDWGLAADPRHREKFDASIAEAFAYAQVIDCPNVHVMAGNRNENVSAQATWEHYLTCIGKACDMARRHGLMVMVEPLNAVDRPPYLLQTQRQALEAVTRLAQPNLKIMLDLYHLQRGEGNLIERMRTSLPYAAHVQIADNPGRQEPGTGEVNFDFVFATLRASGYEGYIGCEYFPSGKSEDSFAWLSRVKAV